jgi:hypothetical protein
MSELQFKCSCADDNENDCYACQFAMDPEFCICSAYNRCEFCEFRGSFTTTVADAETAFQKERKLQDTFENSYAKWLALEELSVSEWEKSMGVGVHKITHIPSSGTYVISRDCPCRKCFALRNTKREFNDGHWMFYQMGGYQKEVEELCGWYRCWIVGSETPRYVQVEFT